jgi:multidrug resistance protein
MIFFSCFLLVIGLMAMDFINPSLPYIMHQLHVSQNTTKGLMVVYILTLGVTQLFYGTFCDNHGRRKAILLAFLIAIIGFIVSALSQNIFMLYVGRFLTALGTAGCPVISRAIISDVCHDATELKKAFSYFSVASQFSPAFAPVLGGFIQQYAGWHWSFAALAIINVITIGVLFYFLPETHQIPIQKTLLVKQISNYFDLFKHRRFMIFNYISAMLFVFTIGYYSLSPFIFHLLGFSPVQNGLFFTAYAVGLAAGALFLAHILVRYNSEKMFLTMMILFPIFFLINAGAFLLFNHSAYLIIIFSFILAFLCGIAAPLTMALCLHGFNQDKGAASAVQSFVKMFLTGVALLACNFVILHNFIELIIIFGIISLIMLVLYIVGIKTSVHDKISFTTLPPVKRDR